MIIALIVIVAIAICGLPIVRVLDRTTRGVEYIGASFLVGCGTIALHLFLLSVVRIAWTRTSVILALMPLFIVASAVAWRRRISHPRGRISPLSGIGGLVIAAPIIGHAIFATVVPLYEWDFFGIWGLKARYFYETRGIDWSFVKSHISHPDYPPLVPLLFDTMSIGVGSWNERAVALLCTALGAALIAIVYGELRGSVAGTLAVLFPSLNVWVGLAEPAVMAFGCAGLLLLRRDLRIGRHTLLPPILLGFAASSKNEGLALIIAAAIGMIVDSRRVRAIIALWPAVVIIAPWMVLRILFRLPTDFLTAGFLERLALRIRDFGAVIRAFVTSPPDQPAFWIVVMVVILLNARFAFTEERFLTYALVLQALAIAGQVLATRADVAVQVSLSMNRLPGQIAPAYAFLCVVLLMNRVGMNSSQKVKEGGVSCAGSTAEPANSPLTAAGEWAGAPSDFSARG